MFAVGAFQHLNAGAHDTRCSLDRYDVLNTFRVEVAEHVRADWSLIAVVNPVDGAAEFDGESVRVVAKPMLVDEYWAGVRLGHVLIVTFSGRRDPIKIGLLKAMLRKAGLSEEEFVGLMK